MSFSFVYSMNIKFPFRSETCKLYDSDVICNQKPSSNLSETNSENKAESLVPCSSLGLPSKNVRIKMYIRFSFSFLYMLWNYISHLKRLYLFENGVLGKMSEPMRVEATKYWRKQHNAKIYAVTLQETLLVWYKQRKRQVVGSFVMRDMWHKWRCSQEVWLWSMRVGRKQCT